MSFMVLQALKAASVAASVQNCENRSIIGTRLSGRQNQSVIVQYQIVFVADIDLSEEERDISRISALTRNPIANSASAHERAQS